MKLIRETDKLLLFTEKKNGVFSLYRQNKDDEEKNYIKIYDLKKKNIYYPFEGTSIKEIVFINAKELPKFISPFGFGFSEKSLNNFFRFKFEDNNITRIVIADDKTYKKADNELLLELSELESLLSSINQEQRACNDTKSILITNYLVSKYPNISFDYKETNNNKDLIFRNLNSKLIEKLTAEDVDNLGRFYVEAANKFSRPDIVKRMIISMQKNAQLVTLQEVIKNYEKLLKENPPESSWQDFFNNYITLFDSRYAHKLDYKNITTGITKYPDLVLVDIYGYVDFYELKKSGMPLLQFDNSHKSFYWSKELAMTIAQASDYLQKARENSISYAKTIKEETATAESDGIEVNIINPRAIIVAGTKEELNTVKKRHHFKNLRESLKDIEFVLYDELLDRLKNLLNSIKLE
ncbi:MAG: DUF4263 domain-containing protein [Flavobacterium sp.]|nr:MAG: DUF4263 domain-containing protein [Flavobacterium sp.]